MMRILIIKKGATGDVVRTTSILRVLQGEIYWATDPRFVSLLPDQVKLFDANSPEDFDLVLSLEEDIESARLASSVTCKKLSGIYEKDGEINYTENTASWFDMSLVSKLGRLKANDLKKKNEKSYQHYLFEMIGEVFSGQTYQLSQLSCERKPVIGIEQRSGHVWPNKAWSGYYQVGKILQSEGIAVRWFQQKAQILDYAREVAECSVVLSGDTLAMHLAMAYQVPCVAIFNCTSASEIYDYGLLSKVISPLLHQNFYSRKFDQEVVDSISVETVMDALRAKLPQ